MDYLHLADCLFAGIQTVMGGSAHASYNQPNLQRRSAIGAGKLGQGPD